MAFKAGPVLWPLPHVIPVGPLVEYGYDDEVLLLTEIEVPANAAGSIKLAAKVSYLVCKDICVPEDTHVELTLPVASEAEASEFAGELAKAKAALAKPLPGAAVYAANPGKGALRLTVTAGPGLFEGVSDARFFPLTWGAVSNPAAQPRTIRGNELILDLQQGDTKETPSSLEGVLVLTKGGSEGARTGYTVLAARGPDSAGAGGLFDRTDASGQVNSGTYAAASGARVGKCGHRGVFRLPGRPHPEPDALRLSGAGAESAQLCEGGRWRPPAAGHRLSRRRAGELHGTCRDYRRVAPGIGGAGLGLSVPIAGLRAGAGAVVFRDGA